MANGGKRHLAVVIDLIKPSSDSCFAIRMKVSPSPTC